MIIRFVLSLISGIVLSLIWWFLLWLAQDKTTSIDSRKPFISKQYYIGIMSASLFTIPIIIFSLFMPLYFEGPSFFKGAIYLLIFWALFVLSLIILGIITFYTFIYRIWSSIQDGHFARTTPVFAVVGFFIPFYNFYWIFQALPGFATDFNGYLKDRRINVPPLSSGLLITWGVLTVTSIIPVVGLFCGIANIFVTLLMISKVSDAINAAQVFKANQIPSIANSGFQPSPDFN